MKNFITYIKKSWSMYLALAVVVFVFAFMYNTHEDLTAAKAEAAKTNVKTETVWVFVNHVEDGYNGYGIGLVGTVDHTGYYLDTYEAYREMAPYDGMRCKVELTFLLDDGNAWRCTTVKVLESMLQ